MARHCLPIEIDSISGATIQQQHTIRDRWLATQETIDRVCSHLRRNNLDELHIWKCSSEMAVKGSVDVRYHAPAGSRGHLRSHHRIGESATHSRVDSQNRNSL